MQTNRPILMSVVQYQEELYHGTITMPQIIEKAVSLGVDGIELRTDKWPNYHNEIASTCSLLQQANLLVTYASFSTLFTPDKESIQAFIQDVDTARDLGASQIRVFQGTPPPDAAQFYRSNQLYWEGAAMNLDYAKQQNLLVVLENFGTAPGATLGDIKTVLNQLWDASLLQTNVDIGNYANQHQDVVQAIKALGPRIVSTHLKDLPFSPDETPTYLGGGRLPLAAIFDAFADLPQRILHVFEFGAGNNADERIKRSLSYLRERNGKI